MGIQLPCELRAYHLTVCGVLSWDFDERERRARRVLVMWEGAFGAVMLA